MFLGTGIQPLLAYPENLKEIWLLILVSSKKTFHAKQICALSSSLKFGPVHTWCRGTHHLIRAIVSIIILYKQIILVLLRNRQELASWVNRAQFHGSAYCRILCLRSRFPAVIQAPNFCASLVSIEYLVIWSTHAQKPTVAGEMWNMLAVSTDFPASLLP